jgi:hypothetical protein
MIGRRIYFKIDALRDNPGSKKRRGASDNPAGQTVLGNLSRRGAENNGRRLLFGGRQESTNGWFFALANP